MSKTEFLKRLKELLADLPAEESREAVLYYETYFNDAGPDMEETIIRELGSPEKLAREIRMEIKKEEEPAELTPKASYSRENGGTGAQSAPSGNGGVVFEKKRWSAGFILLLCILAVPVGIPLLSVLFAIVVTVVSVLFGLIVGAFGAGAGLLFGAVCAFLVGIPTFAYSPGSGFLITGGALVLLGLGILFGWCSVLLCKAVPAFFRLIGRLFGRGKRRYERGDRG